MNYNELHIKKTNPSLYDELYEKYPSSFKWMERVYWYVNCINKKPTCPVCGKHTKFKSFLAGYHTYCSPKCASIGTRKSVIEKQKLALGEDVFKKRAEKAKKTSLTKYGVENVMKSAVFKEKLASTNLEKYGVRNVFESKEVQQSIKAKMIGKYAMQDPIKKQKIINSIRWKHVDIIKYTEDGEWVCKCPHPECGKCDVKQYTIKSQQWLDRKRLGIEPCTNLLPVKPKLSSMELEVRNILDDLGIQYTVNDRSVINPLELDIYIPELKIAIEINGCYWHSLLVKSPTYHSEKFIKCAESGVRMISLWEDWQKFDIRNLISDLINSKNLQEWKEKIFPDLLLNQWPCDFGLIGENWDRHIITRSYNGSSYECEDSGIITISD